MEKQGSKKTLLRWLIPVAIVLVLAIVGAVVFF